MKHMFLVSCSFAALTIAALGSADEPPPAGPGWTGVTRPQDVIAARQALMFEMERLMQPIDSFTVGEPAEPSALTSAATSVAEMLQAVPHLFPPTTNLYDPDAEAPPTIALPAIWQDFDAFYALAGAASAAAKNLASTTGTEPLKAAGRNLRSTCDACHTLFLRTYVPDTVNEEDRDFDFDAIFEDNPEKSKQ